jgi:LacI family transcriptional regulator
VLLVDTGEHPDDEVRAVESLSREVDGFIVVSPRHLHRELGALGPTPAVFVNRPVPEHASILLRTAPAVADALAHLSGLGHTRLAYLGGPSGSWAAGERRTAVRQACSAVGIEVFEPAVGEPTFEEAVTLVPELVGCGVSAVLAFNDQMALGVVAGLGKLGASVPGDISVVGIDDVPMAAMVAPPLTTISLPTGAVGAVAVAMLGEGPAERELFGELVVRHSTARVR